MKAQANAVDSTVWAMLLLLSLVWGGSFIFVEIALRDFKPLSIVLMRVAIGALVLHCIVRLRGLKFPFDAKSLSQFAIMGALNNAIPFTLIVWGQQTIDAGRASMLNATVPLFTVLLAHWLLTDEKLNAEKIVGVLAGFIGVVVLIGPGAEALNSTAGQLAVLGAALSYAFAAIYGKRLGCFDPLVSACGMLTGSTVIMLPLALALESHGAVEPGFLPLLSVIALGVVCTALAYLLYFKILSTAGSSNLSLVTFLIPPGAILMGGLFLSETVGLNEIAGLVLILMGMAIATGLHKRLLNFR